MGKTTKIFTLLTAALASRHARQVDSLSRLERRGYSIAQFGQRLQQRGTVNGPGSSGSLLRLYMAPGFGTGWRRANSFGQDREDAQHPQNNMEVGHRTFHHRADEMGGR